MASSTRAGFEVNTIESPLGLADIYVITTGNCDIITFEHMQKMKDRAIVVNIVHFDNEVQMDRLNSSKDLKRRSTMACAVKRRDKIVAHGHCH